MMIRGAIEQNEDGRIIIRRLNLSSLVADPQHTVVFQAPIGVLSRNEVLSTVPREAATLWSEIADGTFGCPAPFLTGDRQMEYRRAVEEFLADAIATYPAGAFRGPD